ncbi:MAG TPA: cytochrome c oxidase subunit 3 [Flavobacteriales bacterium]|nr:cytochrome c oxidase subunit 3 [Flavobacteriales bacterium]HNU55529.1 cytochrome c oxidase subunit 3 [Flavobacteriales bacterium]
MTLEPFTPEELQARAIRVRRMITWMIIVAIVMFFAGLTSAYVVSMSGGYWVDIAVPQAFWISTAAIVASSLPAYLAVRAARRGNTGSIPLFLVLTLVLGLVFTWSQFRGWKELTSKGNFLISKVLDNKGVYGVDYTIRYQGQALVLENGQFFLPDDQGRIKPLNADLDEQKNTSSSFFYALTGAHLAHLFFGLVSLLVMLWMAVRKRYTPADHAGLWSGVTYWHFLGVLWVYLLSFLVFVH